MTPPSEHSGAGVGERPPIAIFDDALAFLRGIATGMRQEGFTESAELVHDCVAFLAASVPPLEEALRKWNDVSPPHRYECNPLRPDGLGCTCGLQEARDLTRAALSPPEPDFDFEKVILDRLDSGYEDLPSEPGGAARFIEVARREADGRILVCYGAKGWYMIANEDDVARQSVVLTTHEVRWLAELWRPSTIASALESRLARLEEALEQIVDKYEYATADLDAFEDHGGHVGIARHDRAVLQGLGTAADLARAALSHPEPEETA